MKAKSGFIIIGSFLLLSCTRLQSWWGEAQRLPSSLEGDFFSARPVPAGRSERFVHMMHLDGFNAEVFEKMLKAGQLPHFRFLAEHGKVSTRASTVDKSETMKVIPAYLSSKVDTRIVSWWQFDRSRMGFRNFWIDPIEVVNYALGMDFPLYPTVLDVMARDHEEVVSGFSLFRRGVPSENYSRAYLEGIDAVSSFRYFNQADTSASNLTALILQRAQQGRPPRLTTSLLAAADEMTHLNGLTTREESTGSAKTTCITNDKADSPVADAFKIVQHALGSGEGVVFINKTYRDGRIVNGEKQGHFHSVGYDLFKNVNKICFERQSAMSLVGDGEAKQHYLYPEVALAYLIVDIELGRIFNALRSVTFDAGGKALVQKRAPGLEAYLTAAQLENSLFEKTLFLLYGDHGMVNSFKEMSSPLGIEAEKTNRDAKSFAYPFTQVLAENLGFRAEVEGKVVGHATGRLVIDYRNMPKRLEQPAGDMTWQRPEMQALTRQAGDWAAKFFESAIQAVKNTAYQKYWWLLFVNKPLVDSQIDGSLPKVKKLVIPNLVRLYLRGKKQYVAAEMAANQDYFEKNVGLVYGGGALNNAELFIPVTRDGRVDWKKRPSYAEILAYQGDFISRLKKLPGVGLIFIRKQNGDFSADGPLPAKLEIVVLDQGDGEGLITVTVDSATHERIYHYRVAQGKKDPLGYGKLGEGTFGTYAQWNTWSIENKHFYHNAVAGMGSYLYSSSAAVGDITMMHAPGWNFGENLGGHGGLESGEKRTVIVASGPGVSMGELFTRAEWAADQRGTIAKSPFKAFPTVLDVAPTALAYLGYQVSQGEGELTRFSRQGFAEYLQAWVDLQKKVCPDDGSELINLLAKQKGVGSDELRKVIKTNIAQVCDFLGLEQPRLPDYSATKEDGQVLDIFR